MQKCIDFGITTIIGLAQDKRLLQRLTQVAVPALVITGELDAGTPLAMSQLLAAQMPPNSAAWLLTEAERGNRIAGFAGMYDAERSARRFTN